MTFVYTPRTKTQIERRAHQNYAGDSKTALVVAKKRTANPRTPALPDGIKRGGLFSREALIAANQRYRAELAEQQATAKTKEALLLEAAAVTDLTALTPVQIAEFTGMSAAWVRKTLRAAGLMAPAKPCKSTAFVTGGRQ
jgi:hypothetical protein